MAVRAVGHSFRRQACVEIQLMSYRRVIRFSSAALVAALVLGCGEDDLPTDPEASLEVTPLFQGIEEGESIQLTATLGGTPVAVTWVSDNPARASVSSTGLVTGLDACAGAPVTTPPCASNLVPITATATSDGARRSSSITVLKLQGIGLQSGVPLASLSSSVDVLYRIRVPAGATSLTVTTRGGTGDVDLLTQHQIPPPPDFSSFDCASGNAANDETCIHAAPASGTWYILLSAFAPYTGVTLTATIN